MLAKATGLLNQGKALIALVYLRPCDFSIIFRCAIRANVQKPEVDIPNVKNPNVNILNAKNPNVNILNAKNPNVKILNAIRQKISKIKVYYFGLLILAELWAF